MRASNKDALVCDFAQFYQIYDIDSLIPSYAAVLACGLPEDSRSMKALSGLQIDLKTMLLAAAVDDLNIIVWLLAGAENSGITRPESISDELAGKRRSSQEVNECFSSAESFEERRRKIIEANEHVC